MATLKQQYMKERHRILSAISALKKKGIYVQSTDVLPELPQKFTKNRISQLKAIKTKEIRDIAKALSGVEYVSLDTGEIATYADILAHYKNIPEDWTTDPTKLDIYRYQEGYITYPDGADIIINNFERDFIDKYPNQAGQIVERMLNNMLATNSREDVAFALEEARNYGLIKDVIIYASANDSRLYSAINDILAFLPDMGDLTKQDFIEAFESGEDWEAPV